jgi:PAS domain S-box-containing protein
MRSAEFRRIVESIKVAIATTDGEGAITFANVTFGELAGRDDRALAGETLASLFAEEDRRRIQQNIGRIVEGKAASAILEARVAAPDGERWVQAVMQPALDARDQPGGVIAVLHDIGAQRDTEQALYVLTARLLALAEASPVAAMIENAEGEVEMVNEAFIRLLGLDVAPQSLMGLPADHALVKSPAVDPKALEKARARKRGNPTLELKLPEGASVTLERQPILVEGEPSGGVWSPRKETTAEAAAKGAAEIALIEKIGEQLSIAMEGISAVSLRAQQMEFDTEVVDHFERIRRSTETAMSAIGDLVDFSNVSGSIVLRKVDFALRPALANLIGRLLVAAEDHDCRLRLKVEQDVSDALVGDVERLDLILKNLLESAFVLLPGAEVTLQITPEYITESGIQLSFAVVYSDEGTSNPAAMGGAESGMRIAVARFMVAAMGGKLTLAAHPTVGDALYGFTIEFPVRATPPTPHRPTHMTLIGMHALIVSGNAQQRLALSEKLRGWRMLPLEADNAPVALALLERCERDGSPLPLVILTNRLDGQDGFLLAFRIKQHEKLAPTIVMMLASEGKPGDAIACRENGISAYMRYPVNDEQLNQALLAVTGAHAELDSDATATLVTRHSLREQRKGATVLLVDSNRDSQLLAAHYLGREDCSIVVANDVREALSALDQDVYDVVLADVTLEGLRGEDAAQLLRARITRDPESARIIAISTEHSAAFDKAKKAIGFTSTLPKPFRKEDLMALVESIGRVADAAPA